MLRLNFASTRCSINVLHNNKMVWVFSCFDVLMFWWLAYVHTFRVALESNHNISGTTAEDREIQNCREICVETNDDANDFITSFSVLTPFLVSFHRWE